MNVHCKAHRIIFNNYSKTREKLIFLPQTLRVAIASLMKGEKIEQSLSNPDREKGII